MRYAAPQAEDFTICPTCYRLRGSVREDGGTQVPVVLVQDCDCAWAVGRRTGSFPERWLGYDVNQVWELCYGCGAEVLPSGSRWSVWFCTDCTERVRRLHTACGAYVIPIGRHSLMAGFGVRDGAPLAFRGPDAKDAAVIARFLEAFQRLGGRMDRLIVWAARAVALNLTERGLEGGDPVSLPRYLSALAAQPVDRWARFRGLCGHFSVPDEIVAFVAVER